MNNVSITSAVYITVQTSDGDETIGIQATFDSVELSVPLDPANRHYAEIMRQVEAGELTIAPADEEE